jgi:chromosome segregation ATPase
VKQILEDNETCNSIVNEFQLSNSDLERLKEATCALTKARMDLWKLLKLPKIKIENLDESLNLSEKEILTNVNINKSNIKDCEKKQVQLRDKISLVKQEIKVLKLQINKLEDRLKKEQQESRKLRETLRIFISREKFKSIKKILLRRYRKVFLKYSNELSIETKIIECNKRKDEIREEEQSLCNIIKGYNRKITTDKKVIAEMRKIIIGMEKSIGYYSIKLQGIKDYKEVERKFRRQVNELKIVESLPGIIKK